MIAAMGHPRFIEDMPPSEKGRAADLRVGAKAGALAQGEGFQGSSDPAGGRALFDAVLYPNRSLRARGFFVVMAVVVFANLSLGLYFMSIGAWPVLGFCGLDALAVWLAFKVSYRQGRLRERVKLTEDEMLVARVLPSGHETRWRLQPFWTRVEFDRPTRHESQVRVVSKGRTLILGSFLSPAERGRFADALTHALGRARG